MELTDFSHIPTRQELTKITLPAEKAALEAQLAALFTADSRDSSVDVVKHQLLTLLYDDDHSTTCTPPLWWSRHDARLAIHRLQLLRVTLLDQKRVLEQQQQRAVDQNHTLQELLANERQLSRCEFIRTRSLDDIARRKRVWRAVTTSPPLLLQYGWQATRMVKNDTFSWSMQKVLKQQHPRTVAQQTWALWTDPEQWPTLFSADTDAHCRVVERVDSANVIVSLHFRDRQPKQETIQNDDWNKTLALVTSTTTFAGALVVIVRGLPSNCVFASPSLNESVWSDVFFWCVRCARGAVSTRRALLTPIGMHAAGWRLPAWKVHRVILARSARSLGRCRRAGADPLSFSGCVKRSHSQSTGRTPWTEPDERRQND